MRQSLPVIAALVLTSSLASAGSEPAPKSNAELVSVKLIKPLAAKDNEHSKFSRARLPPTERRVRMLDENKDRNGDTFVSFAIDARHGWAESDDDSSWQKAAMTGCVYPSRSEVFIKRGKAFHPAIAALGKKTKAAPDGTCEASAQVSAR